MAHRAAKPKRPHARHSATLMRHAKEELEKGDHLQAAEKTWGAFVHGVKAVANQRHWEYLDHSQLNPIIRALVEESGESPLVNESRLAQQLHRNYYNDEDELEDIAVMQLEVEAGLARLREISRRYRTDPAYRRRADTLRPPNSRYDLRRHRWERITPRRRQNGRPNGRPQNGRPQSPI